MLDINKFKSQIHKYDVERPNLFDTEIGIPLNMSQDMVAYFGTISETLRLFAQNVSLPGVQVSTTPIKRYGLGPNQLMPTGVDFTNSATITYIADGSAKLYSFFYAWINSITSPFNQQPAAGVPNLINGEQIFNPSYVLSYQSTYCSDLKITTYRGAPNKFGGSGLTQAAISAASAAIGAPFIGSLLGGLSNPDYQLEPIKTVILNKAFPIAISGSSLSSSSGDSISTFDVTFAYYNWTLKTFDSKEADEAPGGLF